MITKKKQLNVQHTAWIPGGKLATPLQDPNFEEAFKNTFSPFQFTGSSLYNTPATFIFRKEITMSSVDLAMLCNMINSIYDIKRGFTNIYIIIIYIYILCICS